MIYAGVDIAKVDHVIGAVDERGSEVCGPMGFKNSAAGFERCEAWLEGVAASPADVLVGMEATGRYWMALYAFLASRGYAVAVNRPAAGARGAQVQGPGRRQERPRRRRPHRRGDAHRPVRPHAARDRRRAVPEDPHALPPVAQVGARRGQGAVHVPARRVLPGVLRGLLRHVRRRPSR